MGKRLVSGEGWEEVSEQPVQTADGLLALATARPPRLQRDRGHPAWPRGVPSALPHNPSLVQLAVLCQAVCFQRVGAVCLLAEHCRRPPLAAGWLCLHLAPGPSLPYSPALLKPDFVDFC